MKEIERFLENDVLPYSDIENFQTLKDRMKEGRKVTINHCGFCNPPYQKKKHKSHLIGVEKKIENGKEVFWGIEYCFNCGMYLINEFKNNNKDLKITQILVDKNIKEKYDNQNEDCRRNVKRSAFLNNILSDKFVAIFAILLAASLLAVAIFEKFVYVGYTCVSMITLMIALLGIQEYFDRKVRKSDIIVIELIKRELEYPYMKIVSLSKEEEDFYKKIRDRHIFKNIVLDNNMQINTLEVYKNELFNDSSIDNNSYIKEVNENILILKNENSKMLEEISNLDKEIKNKQHQDNLNNLTKNRAEN